MDEQHYTIDQLCELTGFSRRTIRFYVEESLIEPPAGRGRGGFYYDSQMAKLLKIRELQGQGMRLAAIAALLRKEGAGQSRPEAPEREVWGRYIVAPGVEIHVARDMEEKHRRAVDEVVRLARAILAKGGHPV